MLSCNVSGVKNNLLANVKSEAQQLGANPLISLIGFPTNKPNQINKKLKHLAEGKQKLLFCRPKSK